ncbi:MAG: methyl-accepting chemotaxis protein [Myxococcota bacterium]
MNKLWFKLAMPLLLIAIAAAAWFGAEQLFVPAAVFLLAGLLGTLFLRSMTSPLEDITGVIEGVAGGDLNQRRLSLNTNDELGRLGNATNRMLSQLNALADQAEELADGRVGVLEIEDRVLETERLSEADLEVRAKHGDLERSFISLRNKLRRMTIQARVISKDRLDSPLLDEQIPGELGDAFGLMVRNLRTIADRAKQIARGDLTSHVEGDGELTTAFNQMVNGLKDLVQEITQTALHISTAAEEILAVLRDQELAASHQASSVEETQRTMDSLLTSAKKISESAQSVFKSAEKTQDNNQSIASRITELRSHTERISEILEVIKSIADRSDLLALNASLEGMRAGEAGKGFTLVAAEMRRLAENIKGSVGDVKELVEDISESTMSSAMATDEGTRLSERTTDSALKITLITQQQKSGTEQVTESMEDLSQLINQDVAGTRQVTTAASELVELSENLRDAVDQFRISESPSTSADYPAIKRLRAKKSPYRTESGEFKVPGSGNYELSESGVYRLATSEGRRGGSGEIAVPGQALEEDSEETDGSAVSDAGEGSDGSTHESADEERASVSGEFDLDLPDEVSEAVAEEAVNRDMPTVEFSESMASEDQREVLRELVESSSAALDEDSDETTELADDEGDSVDEQIDALERELLERAGEGGADGRSEDAEDVEDPDSVETGPVDDPLGEFGVTGDETSEADDTAEVEASGGDRKDDETDDEEEER